MWEVSSIICSIITCCFGFLIIKHLTKSKESIFKLKNITTIIVGSTIASLFTFGHYSIITPILTYFVMIIMYKIIFDFSITESVIISGTFVIIIFVSEIILAPIVYPLFPNGEARTVPEIMILLNFSLGLVGYLVSKISYINKIFRKLIKKINDIKIEKTILFIMLTIITISLIFSIIANIYIINLETGICITSIIIFIVLFILYSKEQNEYIYLTKQYNLLLEYVKEFETWVDQTDMNKHEYKNDLAVLATKISDPEIKEFISEKLVKKMTLDVDWKQVLKNLPNGGMKGLLYYKVVLAKNNKVNLKIDISKKSKKIFQNLSDEEYQSLCRLFGIYLDNALDAAIKSKEKSMSVEIYELNGNLSVVISNSFPGKIDLSKISKKGYTSKGTGHGSGLHFAEQILKRNKTFQNKSMICNNYFVQQLIIKIKR